MDYLVLDTETSEFISPEVRVVQLGYCHVVDGEVSSKGSINLFPDKGMQIKQGAVATHGITLEKLYKTGADPYEVFKDLYVRVCKLSADNTWIVGHNLVGFDAEVLNIEFERRGLWRFDFEIAKVIDTGAIYKARQLARKRREGEDVWEFMRDTLGIHARIKWNLKHCCEEFGIDFNEEEAHGAEYDCEKTHEVLQAMFNNGTVEEILGDIYAQV